jgi:bifunctional DNA primase/polymerase-like protein
LSGGVRSAPTDNIGVVTGLSEKAVVECDTHDQVDDVQDLLGHTELRTRTSRGMHLWYASAGTRLRGVLSATV